MARWLSISVQFSNVKTFFSFVAEKIILRKKAKKVSIIKMGFGTILIFVLILQVTCSSDDHLVERLDDVVSEQKRERHGQIK